MIFDLLAQKRKRARVANLVPIPHPIKGEASVFPPQRFPLEHAEIMQNCHINEEGNLAKTPGYSKVNEVSLNTGLTSGYEFVKIDSTKYIIVVGGNKLYLLNPATNEFGDAVTTNIRDIAHFSTFNDLCIVSDGNSTPRKTTDVTSFTILGGSPPYTTFKTHPHKGRIWFIEKANRMRATHSALNDPETMEGFYDFQFQLKEGDELTDVFTYIDRIVFVFQNHMLVYSGQTPSGVNSDFNLIQTIDGMGMPDGKAEQGIGTDTAFLATTGVEIFTQVAVTGDLNTDNLSLLIV